MYHAAKRLPCLHSIWMLPPTWHTVPWRCYNCTFCVTGPVHHRANWSNIDMHKQMHCLWVSRKPTDGFSLWVEVCVAGSCPRCHTRHRQKYNSKEVYVFPETLCPFSEFCVPSRLPCTKHAKGVHRSPVQRNCYCSLCQSLWNSLSFLFLSSSTSKISVPIRAT